MIMNEITENHPLPAAKAHAENSPGAPAANAICPGYKSDSTPSKASDEGDRFHLALGTGDDSGLNAEQVQIVSLCRNYLAQLKAEVRGEVGRHVEILRHLQVAIAGDPTCCTLDYALFTRRLGRADLIDFNFGRAPVADSEDNVQMQAYALGLLETYPNLQIIGVHILHPRRNEVFAMLYTRAEESRLRTETIIARCSVLEPALNPTEESTSFMVSPVG